MTGHPTVRRARTGLCTGLVALGLALGCGTDDPSDPNASEYVISGRVLRATDRRPLTGVLVTFTSETLDQARDTTGSDGKFSMTVITDTDEGWLEASKDGYEPRRVSVLLDSAHRRIDVELTPSAE